MLLDLACIYCVLQGRFSSVHFRGCSRAHIADTHTYPTQAVMFVRPSKTQLGFPATLLLRKGLNINSEWSKRSSIVEGKQSAS